MAYVVERSRSIPVTVEDAFAGTLPIPLPVLFRRWYGPIPPIKQVRGQTGDWGTAGQTRTVTLTQITGPMAPLVGRVEGQWRFTPAGTGTQVTWRWTIHPRSALAAPALPVLAKLWQGYARQALEELSAQLVG